MTEAQVIQEAYESASEWIEMSEDPASIVAGVLANRIVRLNSYINYLEKRLENDSVGTTRVN